MQKRAEEEEEEEEEEEGRSILKDWLKRDVQWEEIREEGDVVWRERKWNFIMKLLDWLEE
jgi:hypothetical protein